MDYPLTDIYLCEIGKPVYSKNGDKDKYSVSYLGVRLCTKETEKISTLKEKYSYLTENENVEEIEVFKCLTDKSVYFSRKDVDTEAKDMKNCVMSSRNLALTQGKKNSSNVFKILGLKVDENESMADKTLTIEQIKNLEFIFSETLKNTSPYRRKNEENDLWHRSRANDKFFHLSK